MARINFGDFSFDVSANVQLRMEESLNLIFNFVLKVCYHVAKCHLFCGILLSCLLITLIKYKTVFVVRSWCLLSCYHIGNSRLFHGV